MTPLVDRVRGTWLFWRVTRGQWPLWTRISSLLPLLVHGERNFGEDDEQ